MPWLIITNLQALVLARFGSSYEDIRLSTAGVVFLGTPHDGSDAAALGEKIAKILGNNARLLASLKSQSSELFGLSRDFDAEYQELKAICYYEKVERQFIGGMVNLEVRVTFYSYHTHLTDPRVDCKQKV
jgi:hypothetical protein